MKNLSKKLLLRYIAFFVFSLFIVFFVWYKTTPSTWESTTILTTNGLSHFKKWLDLAGWVRLTYKIDFSKYDQTYSSSPAQLMQVKKTAQDIILKNIDKRISALGVSDYNAYVQKLSDGEYVVVEIWWVQDLESAKKLIGKTVELEFKVPNEAKEQDPEVYAERQKMAEAIFADVVKNPASMQDIWATKGSQDVVYSRYDEATLDQLPMFYKSNIAELSSLQSATVYPVLSSGLYHMSISASEDGKFDTQTLQWFTVVYYRGKKETTLEEIPLGDVLSYADKNKLAANRSVLKSFDGKTQSARYDAATKSVIFVWEQDLPKQDGYDVAVFKVNSWADADAALKAIQNGERENVEQVLNGWKTIADITALVPSYVYNDANKVSLSKELDASYIVKIRDIKKENDTIYPVVTIPVTSEKLWNDVVYALTHKTLYSFDDIFVSDSLRRVPAKDPKTESVLNGAYFKYASVGQSQTGKPVVSIQFDDKWKEIFCNLTEQHIGKQMAIFVGWVLTTSPVIRDKICGWAAQIDWAFDIKGAKKLADDLNSGALPAPLLLSHEETIAPSLGQNALNAALLAGLIGLIAVYGFMFSLYGFKKANIALLGLGWFLVFLLAITKALGIVSSLSSIAAVILSLGMAVDANVIMYERIREELKAGKSMQTAIEDWYARSWAPIRDGNTTTGIIGLLLFLVWVNVFKGFGTMMLINMILILFVITPLTKVLLKVFYRNAK
jgi:protein-export membrane protein SecD